MVALTSPPGGATFSAGTSVGLAATATDSDGMITTVEFLVDGVKLGQVATPPYLTSWNSAPVGTHVLAATAIDNDGNSITSPPVVITVRATDPGRFVNSSIRNNVSAGTGTLIVGFVVGGTGTTGNKPLLLRAIGPALAPFGVASFSADPVAILVTGSSTVATNDNWAGNADVVRTGAQVGAFPLTDPASRDAALATSRPPGAHTLQVSGPAGVALAEIYDATPLPAYTPATPRLINVSARALIGPGNDELIAGVVIAGATDQTVLIRAIGPALSGFGVTNALADPRLEIYRAGDATAIASNDDWGGGAGLATVFARVGAFLLPPTSRDAAVLVRLAPGAYTARVTCPPGATGVALVDLYEVP